MKKGSLKKWMALLMLMAILLSSASLSLAEAAPALKAEEGAEIEVVYWAGSESDRAAWELLFKNLAQDHPEIKIVAQEYPSTSFRDALDTRIAGNDWPDVIRYTYQRLGKFKESDVMLDLTPYIPQENLDDLAPAFLSGCMYEGKLVAMPHHTDVTAIYYNKKMFADAGIQIPATIDQAWSWEELTEIAKTLKEKNNLEYAFGGIWENGSGYRYLPFLYMNGGMLLSEDQKESRVNSPENLEAIQLYDQWVKDKLVVNTAFTGKPVTNELFTQGTTAFSFSGSWHCSFMDNNMPDKENWGVTYMPQRNGRTGTDMGGNGIFAYKNTPYPIAAAIVTEYITSKEQMKAFCEAGNFIPVRQSLIEEGLDFAQFPEQMKIFMELAAKIDPKMAADETSAYFQRINDAFSEAMDPLIVNSSATPEEVLEALDMAVQEILSE